MGMPAAAAAAGGPPGGGGGGGGGLPSHFIKQEPLRGPGGGGGMDGGPPNGMMGGHPNAAAAHMMNVKQEQSENFAYSYWFGPVILSTENSE